MIEEYQQKPLVLGGMIALIEEKMTYSLSRYEYILYTELTTKCLV